MVNVVFGFISGNFVVFAISEASKYVIKYSKKSKIQADVYASLLLIGVPTCPKLQAIHGAPTRSMRHYGTVTEGRGFSRTIVSLVEHKLTNLLVDSRTIHP